MVEQKAESHSLQEEHMVAALGQHTAHCVTSTIRPARMLRQKSTDIVPPIMPKIVY